VEGVHRLQRLLLSSWSAKCLAVRKVTQDNRGKRTAGVDGIASLTPEERMTLVEDLDVDREPRPTRRVWIPKPGSDEKRPLGIPTMTDRATQALVKLALEPEWEAKFEPNSYGFRPGRSAHDAIEAIFNAIRFVPKYVLDADIAKCFDRINHDALLDKLGTFPALRHVIQAWLKAGVLDDGELFPTEEGTPQGGVASPLLANVALHGLEQAICEAFHSTRTRTRARTEGMPIVVRYADDFVVLHRNLEVIRESRVAAQAWLKEMGLELKPSKTRVAHTLEEQDGVAGFDFLGFNVRQYPVGKYHTGSNTVGEPLGFKTLITPAKGSVERHYQRLRQVVQQMRGAPQGALIMRLNPLIRGWGNYYRSVVSSRTFSTLDDRLYHLLRSWATSRHHDKGRHWVCRKYWPTGWSNFGTGKLILARHDRTKHVGHVKIQGGRSPFDGDWAYWANRWGHYPGIPLWVAMIVKRQGGRCARCNLTFVPGQAIDVIEVHHRDGDHSNNVRRNLEALHGHCHDAVHRVVTVSEQPSAHDKGYPTEEPCEGESLTHGSEDQPGG
jgi:RNA-directed DNA polymerase